MIQIKIQYKKLIRKYKLKNILQKYDNMEKSNIILLLLQLIFHKRFNKKYIL